MKYEPISEWQIIFNDLSDMEDIYTEDESEYNDIMDDLTREGQLDEISQCVRKDYIWDEELEDYVEDYVEVLYDTILNETKKEVKTKPVTINRTKREIKTEVKLEETTDGFDITTIKEIQDYADYMADKVIEDKEYNEKEKVVIEDLINIIDDDDTNIFNIIREEDPDMYDTYFNDETVEILSNVYDNTYLAESQFLELVKEKVQAKGITVYDEYNNDETDVTEKKEQGFIPTIGIPKIAEVDNWDKKQIIDYIKDKAKEEADYFRCDYNEIVKKSLNALNLTESNRVIIPEPYNKIDISNLDLKELYDEVIESTLQLTQVHSKQFGKNEITDDAMWDVCLGSYADKIIDALSEYYNEEDNESDVRVMELFVNGLLDYIENQTDITIVDDTPRKITESKKLTEGKYEDTLKETVEEAVINFMVKTTGFDEEEARDYMIVEVKTEDDTITVGVRAELSITELDNLCHALDRLIKKYDKEAYFEVVTSGIIEAVIDKNAYNRDKHKKIKADKERYAKEIEEENKKLEAKTGNADNKIVFIQHRDYGDFRADIQQGKLEDGRYFVESDGEITIYKKGFNPIEILDKMSKTDDEDELERLRKVMAENEDESVENFNLDKNSKYLTESEDEVEYGKYYVKLFNEYGTDMDTIWFDSEQEACDYARKEYENKHYAETAVYYTENDECLYVWDEEE